MKRRYYLALVGGLLSSGCLGGNQNTQNSNIGSPKIGNPNSQTVVNVYEDFMCPHCRDFNLEIYPRLKENYIDPGEILYIHNDFPIPVHNPLSWQAAIAARSVQVNLGEEEFWTYKSQIFENQNSVSVENLVSWAQDLGMEEQTIRSDIENSTYRNVVEQDRQEGVNKGVRGTPSIFINGEKLNTISYNSITRSI